MNSSVFSAPINSPAADSRPNPAYSPAFRRGFRLLAKATLLDLAVGKDLTNLSGSTPAAQPSLDLADQVTHLWIDANGTADLRRPVAVQRELEASHGD